MTIIIFALEGEVNNGKILLVRFFFCVGYNSDEHLKNLYMFKSISRLNLKGNRKHKKYNARINGKQYSSPTFFIIGVVFFNVPISCASRFLENHHPEHYIT